MTYHDDIERLAERADILKRHLLATIYPEGLTPEEVALSALWQACFDLCKCQDELARRDAK